MSPSTLALGAFALVVGTAVLLLVYKTVNTWRRRIEAGSRASYIAVFGELTARGSYPHDLLSQWADDPVFRESLVDFMRLLDGVQRDRLLGVARDLGIVDAAVDTLRTARSKRRRIKAAVMLSELGDSRTAPALLEALGDSAAGVRLNASAALAKIGEPDLVDTVLESLDEASVWDASRTLDHVVSLGTSAVDGLLGYLGDISEMMPTHGGLALKALGSIGDFKAEPTLLLALGSVDAETRTVAASALQSCGTERCVVPLIEAMADHDAGVRARAAKSLGAHFDVRAIEPLFAGLADRDWRVRKNSARALARLPSGVEALQRALRANDHFARDAAREQLIMLGVPAGSGAESSVASDGDWIADQLQALDHDISLTFDVDAAVLDEALAEHGNGEAEPQSRAGAE